MLNRKMTVYQVFSATASSTLKISVNFSKIILFIILRLLKLSIVVFKRPLPVSRETSHIALYLPVLVLCLDLATQIHPT